MEGAEGDEVAELRLAAVHPMLGVVDVDEAVVRAAREGAAAVPRHDGAAKGRRESSGSCGRCRGCCRPRPARSRSGRSRTRGAATFPRKRGAVIERGRVGLVQGSGPRLTTEIRPVGAARAGLGDGLGRLGPSQSSLSRALFARRQDFVRHPHRRRQGRLLGVADLAAICTRTARRASITRSASSGRSSASSRTVGSPRWRRRTQRSNASPSNASPPGLRLLRADSSADPLELRGGRLERDGQELRLVLRRGHPRHRPHLGVADPRRP